MYDNLPQLIKDTGQCCVWNLEKRKGRNTKVPYNPITGRHAYVDNPETFVDFETAVNAVSNYSGIGIRVNGRIIAIDLDHCIENGQLLSWSKEIVEQFNNTYIEISPSVTGIRILALMPEGYTYDSSTFYIKKGNVEVYVAGATNRFVTLTGNAYQHSDVTEQADAMQWLLDTHMKRKQPLKMINPNLERDSYLSDESVLEKAMKAANGEKFKKLWNADTTGYSSHSEADAALCSMLAFYCNGNMKQVDRLFRQSALYRDKWDEQRGADTYGNLTIMKAVGNMKNFYQPIKINPNTDFNDELQRLVTHNPSDTLKYPWTDIGAGKLFADFYKEVLRYVPERRNWFCYEDGAWSMDTGGLKAMRYCMELANFLHLYALEIKDEHQRKSYMDYSKRWQTHGYRVNVLKDAQVHHPISFLEFDKDPYIFNCSNGTLHLDSGKFTEHCSSDLLTKISAVAYDPLAHSERWDNFITEIMSNDQDRALFLQKVLGYALSGDTRHEYMSILYGATTRNGKGTLCESVLKVFGSYGCTARPETIAQKNSTNSSQPSEDVARLAGVRFVNIAEPGKSLVLNAALVKNMTGNDTINARFLHENSFDFSPQFKLYINTNYLPVVNDMTVFASGRVIIIPFERHFDESEQDKGLKREFIKPQVQSAILNWLLKGYEQLQLHGLHMPQSVINATGQYEHDSNKTLLFIEDCLGEGADYEERTSQVYNRYKSWCMENGQYAESMKNFKQSLSAVMEVKRKRPKSGGEKTTMVVGYRLISDFLRG
ncbi:nucleoside triphosphatase [Erysipelotrichaceae bacterium MTC7]|nr:nucleoside triphosphatase [Erysipelotrichaceae bacterium MTC7]